MRNRLTAGFLFAVSLILAQTTGIPLKRCATNVPDKRWDEWFNAKVEELKQSQLTGKAQNESYVIPVIFHVIHGAQAVGTFPNLSQIQINSQIGILNNDYAGTGFNSTNITSSPFSPTLVANCNITFCLAEKDPSGNLLVEKGIERINYATRGWSNPATYTASTDFRNYLDDTVKVNTIWDPQRYLNIWITDVNLNVGLLGYSTFPPGSGLIGLPAAGTIIDDGVWCWAKAVGNTGTVASPLYDKGRTLSHEIGHYLGLRHIWGDANCGDDYCADTPTQQQANTNCPSFPHITCNNGPNGDLFINFMDYSPDNCLYMFTNDQHARMQAAMINSPLRKLLTASAMTLCTGAQAACDFTLCNFSDTDTLLAYRRVTASPSDAGCLQGAGKAGYLVGTNCYGDKEKAEFISASKYNSVTNPYITGVIVLFYQSGTRGTQGTGTVGVNIYGASSATLAPGNLLGSVSESLGTITSGQEVSSIPYCGNPGLSFGQAVIQPHKFVFAAPIPAPQYFGFYASVVLPTQSGDTAAVLDKRTATVNTAWERWSDSTWHSMKVAWGNARNFNLAILPLVECKPITGIREQSPLANGINLFPNPSDGHFIVITTLSSSQTISLRVYNLLGELVHQELVPEARQNVIDVNMSEQHSGIYFVEIANPQEKLVKRISIVH